MIRNKGGRVSDLAISVVNDKIFFSFQFIFKCLNKSICYHCVLKWILLEPVWEIQLVMISLPNVMSSVGRSISLGRTVKTYSLSLPVNLNTNSTNLTSLPQPEWALLRRAVLKLVLVVIKMCEIAMCRSTMLTEITLEFYTEWETKPLICILDISRKNKEAKTIEEVNSALM